MKKIVLLFIFCILITGLFANLDKVIYQTKVSELNASSIRFYNEWKQKHDEAMIKAKLRDIPVIIDNEDVYMELSYFDEFDHPIYHITHNSNAALTVSTDHVYPGGIAGLNLTGAGIVVREWDGGGVRLTHQEYGSRVIQVDGPISTHYHSTHVAGTIMASGVQTNSKGMAYEANLRAFEWTNDTSEMASEATLGMLLSNHSYGFGRGWVYTPSWVWYGQTDPGEDWSFGFYNNNSEDFDAVAYDAPYYLIVESAGNDRGDGPGSDPDHPNDGPYDCVADMAVSKNVLTVAAVEDMTSTYSVPSDVVMSSFSSWGPCDDGRIKPDISANGTYLYSTYDGSDTDYNSISGTSMAAPSVTGSLALIQEHSDETDGVYLRSSTLKALTLHCADEAGSNDGPDYAFGWGLMNTERMAQYISNDGIDVRIEELTLTNTGQYQVTLPANGSEPLKATLCWTDPEGTPVTLSLDPANPMLINDIDIRITKGASTYYPWKLDRLNPANAATNSGDNSVDNVEQIYIANPTAENYTITVTHKGTLVDDTGSTSSQQFGLIISGVANLIPDITVNPPSFSETLGLNQTEQQTLTITNNGDSGSTLNYNLIIENNTRSLNSNLKYKAYRIKEKIAKGLTITYEESNILKEFEKKNNILIPAIGRAEAICYPSNTAYWSGTTTITSKTDNSEARAYGGTNAESGWIMFDVSAILDGSAITSIEFHFYVNSTNWPYWSTTPVSNDPITTSASILHADIIAEESSGYYNQQDESSGYAPGWKNLTLGGGANTDLFNQLTSDWFAIGISSRDGSNTYYLEIDGWNQTNVPYIVVNYTPNIPVLEVTSPNGGETWANGNSHNITWDHSGAALANVKLELSTNNGTAYSDIIASTSNDGTYEWTVSGSASEECLVRISDPAVPSTNDVSNAVFRIYDTVSWLMIDQDNGSLSQGSSDYLTLTFDSSGLSAGTYNANIVISSNDPDEATVTIPVALTVNDNSSSGSGNNGGGSGPAVVDLPLTNIDGSSVNPDVSVDPVGEESITVNVTVTDEIQGSVPVANPDKVIISYAVDVIGTITGVNLNFDLEFTPLTDLDQIHWFNGTNWVVPNNVSWSTQDHVTFDLTLTDRNASTEIILSRDDPLPVSLSSFTAIYSNGSPIINWVTQSESDNIGWNVYRSYSYNFGQAQILNLDLIPGNGTTSEPSIYSFTDEYEVHENSTYWYWIESISSSGETESFGPVSLTITSDGNEIQEIPLVTDLHQNFPNPFNPSTLISFEIKEGETGVLSIYNIKGQLIVKQEFGEGRHTYPWDAKNHSSGIYLYKLQAKRFSKIMKMLLVK